MSTENDICIVDAESDNWGEKALEKLLKMAEKLAVTFTDEKLGTYLVDKQGVGNMSKMRFKSKRKDVKKFFSSESIHIVLVTKFTET